MSAPMTERRLRTERRRSVLRALWRGNFEHWDVLGVALRLRENDSISPQCAPSDQDLLFATIVSPFTMPFAPFTTNAHDYLDNHYWAVSPFDVGNSIGSGSEKCPASIATSRLLFNVRV